MSETTKAAVKAYWESDSEMHAIIRITEGDTFMKVVTFIFGILLTIAGIIFLFHPGEAFLSTGYVIAIMLFVYGVIGTINVITKRSRPAFLWASIPALIIGVVSMFLPGDAGTIHIILLFLVAFWFVMQGISSIYLAVRSRESNPVWVLTLIVGIISIFLGAYAAVHPLVGVFAIGILVGIFLIEAGIDLMVIGTTIGRVEAFVRGAEAFAEFNEAQADADASEAQQPSDSSGSDSDEAE